MHDTENLKFNNIVLKVVSMVAMVVALGFTATANITIAA
jgi:hypothetical protein